MATGSPADIWPEKCMPFSSFAMLRKTMPILSIRHVTTYRYQQPVAFGAHRMMLRPRDDDDQTVLEFEIQITPRPKRVTWTRDDFGNHVATAQFVDRAAELSFLSTVWLDHAPADFRATAIADYARTYPFAYAAEDWLILKRFVRPPLRRRELDRWSTKFFRADGSAETHTILVAMTKTLHRTFSHRPRHEHGIQSPVDTINLGSGSCRDLAMLRIAVLRSRGLVARFVSGYLHLPDDEKEHLAGGNTHAWVQVYVPGPRLGRLRSVGRHCGKPEPRPCGGRSRSARGNPAARHLVREGVRPSGDEGGGEGEGCSQGGSARVLMKMRAGYKISYECSQPTPTILMLSVHPSRVPDLLTPDRPWLSPAIAANAYHDGFGNTCHVIHAPAGRLELSADFMIRDTGAR